MKYKGIEYTMIAIARVHWGLQLRDTIALKRKGRCRTMLDSHCLPVRAKRSPRLMQGGSNPSFQIK